MQHTNQYQFNLIESGDAFSAEPLNENAEKMEEALSKAAEETDAALTELSGRMPQIEMGSYTGTGTLGSGYKTAIKFGFNPNFVLVWSTSAFFGLFGKDGVSRVISETSSMNPSVSWGEKTLTLWTAYSDAAYQLNAEGINYNWIALGLA